MTLKEFLEKLRGSDEAVKRRWVIGGSAFVMTVIITVWLAFFNTFFREGVLPNAEGEGNPPFFERIGRGAALLYENARGAIGYVADVLKSPRVYIVHPPGQ